MSQQIINIGTVANDRTGDTWRDAMVKANANDTELYANVANNQIIINSDTDFPIQDATTITLSSNTIYILGADITVGKEFRCEDGFVFTGFNVNGNIITSTVSGNMFSGTTTGGYISHVQVACPLAQVFEFTDTVAGSSILIVDNVVVKDCRKLGSYTNLRACQFVNSSTENASGGISLFGTGGTIFSIARLGLFSTDPNFIGVDYGTSQFFVNEVSNLIVFGAGSPTAYGISGLTASGNIPVGRKGMVTGCEFIGVNDLQNIQNNDARWSFKDCSPTPDSRSACDIYLGNEGLTFETITVANLGEWYEVGIPAVVGASWMSDVEDRFTVSTGGVMTYIGADNISLDFIGKTTVDKVGGGSDLLEVRLAINWDGTVTDSGVFKTRGVTKNTNFTTVPAQGLLSLVTNDNVRLIYSNVDGVSNIEVLAASLTVTE